MRKSSCYVLCIICAQSQMSTEVLGCVLYDVDEIVCGVTKKSEFEMES